MRICEVRISSRVVHAQKAFGTVKQSKTVGLLAPFAVVDQCHFLPKLVKKCT